MNGVDGMKYWGLVFVGWLLGLNIGARIREEVVARQGDDAPEWVKDGGVDQLAGVAVGLTFVATAIVIDTKTQGRA